MEIAMYSLTSVTKVMQYRQQSYRIRSTTQPNYHDITVIRKYVMRFNVLLNCIFKIAAIHIRDFQDYNMGIVYSTRITLQEAWMCLPRIDYGIL
jgi:hypothetical protein